MDDIAQPSSVFKTSDKLIAASKDVKVTFEMAFENIINYMKDESTQSYQVYNNFLKILSADSEDSTVISLLIQLKDNIYFLEKENDPFVSVILKFDWTSRSDDVSSSYQELILNLISAHTSYLFPCLSMIVKIFYTVEDDLIGFVSQEENVKFQKAHKLLQDIIPMVPLAPGLLYKLLHDKFPYLTRSSHKILCYAVNMLNICTYLPSSRPVILELLIDKMLYIDVHCPKDKIQMCELEKDDEECLSMEIDEEKEAALQDPDSMAYPLANTMDFLMHSFLKFIECTCYKPGGKEINWKTTKKLYRELLTIFDKHILSTHGSSHVQFIMFYICSLRPALCDGFLDYLWKKVQNPYTSSPIKQMAAFYIGSFLARASYIGINTVTACFDLMCNWIHSYIKNQDTRNWGDVAVHTTFHCVCQSVFYVFAFRHKELIEMKDSIKYLRSLNFERIVMCRLNPLKYCQPMVVQNFASIARNYQIAYCYPVIEKNNRLLMASILEGDSKDGLHVATLNTVFPFDPYVLKRSKKWIDPLYRIYKSFSEDEQQEEDENFMEEESLATNSNMFTYATSPGFKKQHSLSPINR